jgi:hypothetical protein
MAGVDLPTNSAQTNNGISCYRFFALGITAEESAHAKKNGVAKLTTTPSAYYDLSGAQVAPPQSPILRTGNAHIAKQSYSENYFFKKEKLNLYRFTTLTGKMMWLGVT